MVEVWLLSVFDAILVRLTPAWSEDSGLEDIVRLARSVSSLV
jgi:hypothetical protein